LLPLTKIGRYFKYSVAIWQSIELCQSPNKSAASLPLPAPNSRIDGARNVAITLAHCRASTRANIGEISGAVTKSPAAPNFVAPAA
jgi:hypothetical protein